jgi:hypothetical protein
MASTETYGACRRRTWLTQAEYKDIKVTQGGQVLFEGKKGWKFVSGDWKWDGDVLRQSGKGPTFAPTPARRMKTTRSRSSRKLGAEGFLVTFAAPDEKASPGGTSAAGQYGPRLEVRGVDAARVPGRIETNRCTTSRSS